MKVSMPCRKNIDKWYIWLQRLMAGCCSTRSDCQMYIKPQYNNVKRREQRRTFAHAPHKAVNQFNGNLWFLIHSLICHQILLSAVGVFSTCFIDLARNKNCCLKQHRWKWNVIGKGFEKILGVSILIKNQSLTEVYEILISIISLANVE